MPRTLKVAAAQLGPNHLTTPREEIISRMIKLLQSASNLGAQTVLFPETALTNFFPRYLIASQTELDAFFEHGDSLPTSPNTKPLFDEAQKLGVDISVGFAERDKDGKGWNTQIYYSAKKGEVIAKYRKVHLPGTKEPFENPDAINQLEKRYFEPGNLGFKAFRTPDLIPGAAKKGSEVKEHGKGDPIMGMLICNDRRWAEGWRCYGLQGVEVVMCGYNTTGYAPDLWGARKPMTPEEAEVDAVFHHKLVMQANSYMNSCFSISAAKAGLEDGKFDLIGGSCITDPEGHIVAEAKGKGDEIVFAEIDLEECRQGKEMVSAQA
ncbi:D-N-alpha-carbamilase [Hyphodiscus hymeniophilus]|uniref:D-N-alpha-carbamilase n=1 Tax=Hyphodiscus hymeniophilus TaxID=353542 RepID=A0A9P7AWB4_9HELO|nr:D-N-alpha-carbamilase [Hyphodiscus hymeniophilus]